MLNFMGGVSRRLKVKQQNKDAMITSIIERRPKSKEHRICPYCVHNIVVGRWYVFRKRQFYMRDQPGPYLSSTFLFNFKTLPKLSCNS